MNSRILSMIKRLLLPGGQSPIIEHAEIVRRIEAVSDQMIHRFLAKYIFEKNDQIIAAGEFRQFLNAFKKEGYDQILSEMLKLEKKRPRSQVWKWLDVIEDDFLSKVLPEAITGEVMGELLMRQIQGSLERIDLENRIES